MKRLRIIVALMGALMFYPASCENSETADYSYSSKIWKSCENIIDFSDAKSGILLIKQLKTQTR